MIRRPALRAAVRLAAIGVGALTLSGCISLLPKTKPAQLYRLAPPPAAAAPATSPGPDAVAVFRSNGQFQEEASDDR
ncbi:MAG: ABC transporter, partial [Proteobacteria bacterium]|nr:ABC transporter [Pseudomonadota bacterium]